MSIISARDFILFDDGPGFLFNVVVDHRFWSDQRCIGKTQNICLVFRIAGRRKAVNWFRESNIPCSCETVYSGYADLGEASIPLIQDKEILEGIHAREKRIDAVRNDLLP